jgi:2-oxoglutarate dehydrogenase E1 component
MDRFSFLNAAHSQFIEDLYQQYLKYPDSIEPSWKSFFQGFDFALANYSDDEVSITQLASNVVVTGNIPENIEKEFKVINLINDYKRTGWFR